MKELLFKRKGRFMLYILACFMPVIDQMLMNLAISFLLGSFEKGSTEYFIKAALIAAGVVVLGAVMYFVSRFMRISFMRDTLLDVRTKAFDKILKSSYQSFNKNSKDVYISNLINDINTFEKNFFLKLINFIFNTGTYGVSIIVLLILDYKFGLSIFFVSMDLFFIVRGFQNKTVKLQEEISENNESFTTDISNTFNGLEILKLNRIEDEFLSKSMKSIFRLERKKFNYAVFTDAQQRFSSFASTLIFIGTLAYLLTLISKGESFARIAFMLQVSNSCVWHIAPILPLFNELKASSKIYDKITKPEEENQGKSQKEKDFVFTSTIDVRNLSFHYGEKEILKNTSFQIEKGKKYLLKGASGAGKSTLIKILSMTYEDYDGEIIVDKVDYKEIKESRLNENVSFVYQDVFLFEDTIFNNIALFKPFTESEVLEAAKKADLEKLLTEKEKGLYELLEENGKNLSGGQRQRISIARAIIKNSSILFADEATSSLDEELGRHIENTILSMDSTVIAISHRYYEGITEKYDYVLEIKNGEVHQYLSDAYFQEVAV